MPQQDPWAEFRVNPAPQPAQQGPINTGVDPADTARAQSQDLAERRFAYDRQRDSIDDRRESEEEGQNAAQADERARASLMRFISGASDLALDADDNGGWFETGTSGSIMRNLPVANAAKDLSANAATLRAQLAFDALQAMRDASQTGGALGQVSEIELQLLESSIANVNPANLTHETLLANLDRARNAYAGMLFEIDPEAARQAGYDPQASRSAWDSIISEYGDAFNVEDYSQLRAAPPPTSSRAGQTGFGRARSTQDAPPADISDIMRRYGVE